MNEKLWNFKNNAFDALITDMNKAKQKCSKVLDSCLRSWNCFWIALMYFKFISLNLIFQISSRFSAFLSKNKTDGKKKILYFKKKKKDLEFFLINLSFFESIYKRDGKKICYWFFGFYKKVINFKHHTTKS